MSTTFLEQPSSAFQYFLHLWREDPETGARQLGELLGTDGERVRSLRSRGSFLTFEEVEALRVAGEIVETVEGEWEPEAPFFGFESLSDTEMVAILHNTRQIDEQWAVFPCVDHSFPPGELTETAVTAQEGTRHHVICGAEIQWQSGKPYVEAALEVRSWKQEDVRQAAELLEHVESWELRATAERRGDIQEVGLVPEGDRRVRPDPVADGRLEAEFPLDSVILQNLSDHPSVQPWFVLQFDTDICPVPEIWRRFWMSFDLAL